jgi:hypothetical protein
MKKYEIDSLRVEYKPEDLGKGIRGKYYDEYKKGNNLILLSPDVAKVFSDDAVNTALRSLIALAKKSVKESRAIKNDSPKPEPAIDRIREKPTKKCGASRKG